ncbi:MAG: FecR family protein [Candidatus Cloacimonetes bacterium]|nr:FecR family protein [Candidatus Cloacimonadota bacterium]
MKTMLIFLILLMSCLLFAEDPVAICMKVKGEVTVSRDGENAELATGAMLYHNDELMSAADSYAAVKFVDGSALLKLFPNSHLRLNATIEDGELNKRPYVERGGVYSRVMRRAGVYEVESPTTVASVKGTDFLVSVDEFGLTELITMSGVVSFRNKRDNNEADVGAGQMAQSSGEGPIETTAFNPDDLDPETRELIEDEGMNRELRIELEDAQGDTRTIIIEME